jgi:hypothetical protein
VSVDPTVAEARKRTAILADLGAHGAEVREATDTRNRAIRDAHDAGLPLRAIGEAVGLSHTAVASIVKKEQT